MYLVILIIIFLISISTVALVKLHLYKREIGAITKQIKNLECEKPIKRLILK